MNNVGLQNRIAALEGQAATKALAASASASSTHDASQQASVSDTTACSPDSPTSSTFRNEKAAAAAIGDARQQAVDPATAELARRVEVLEAALVSFTGVSFNGTDTAIGAGQSSSVSASDSDCSVENVTKDVHSDNASSATAGDSTAAAGSSESQGAVVR